MIAQNGIHWKFDEEAFRRIKKVLFPLVIFAPIFNQIPWYHDQRQIALHFTAVMRLQKRHYPVIDNLPELIRIVPVILHITHRQQIE